MRFGRRLLWLYLLSLLLSSSGHQAKAADNLIFVTWDGFRWQEMFHGADEQLLNKEFGGIAEPEEVRQRYWRETAEARRAALLPFVWGQLVPRGQLFGDPSRNAAAQVTNGRKFSYPGYNEMFVGFPDDRINSNSKVPNPNLNVLEFLQRRPAFTGRVAAFATWDVMEWILNRERGGFLVHTGWRPLDDEPLTAGQLEVNALVRELPRYWPGNVFDIVTHRAAREHLIKHRPRVLYAGLGETDEWAHARRYDLYLDAAQRSDQYLRELWETLQSLPEYKDRTALVLTTDHGRGTTPRDWTNHSADTPEAEFIWIGVLGPDVPSLGVRQDVTVTQSQIAATLAHLVGEDFVAGSSAAAQPLPLGQ